jgi:NAD-dependent SIR2 family protein deacetylase
VAFATPRRAENSGGGRRVRATVREKVAEILTPDLTRPQATATHEALVTLSQTRDGRCRLITTNFDRLFAEVARERGLANDGSVIETCNASGSNPIQ